MSKKAKKEKEEQTAKKVQVPKEREPLRMILTILLVLVGIGELALWGYVGVSVRQGVQDQQAYEEDRTQGTTSTSQSRRPASYAGPWLIIQDGVVTWEWDEGRPIGIAASTDGRRQTGDKRLSTLSVPVISYDLAEDTDVIHTADGQIIPIKEWEEASAPTPRPEQTQNNT